MALDDIIRNPFGLLKLAQLFLLIISTGCVFGPANGWWYYVGGTLVAAFLNTLVMLLCYFWKQSFEDSFLELSHTLYFVVALFISAILLFVQPGYETAPWMHYDPIPAPSTVTEGPDNEYSKEGAFVAGGVFCLFLCLSYAAELYFLIMRLLNHRGRPTPPTHVSNQNATDLPPNIPVGSQPGA